MSHRAPRSHVAHNIASTTTSTSLWNLRQGSRVIFCLIVLDRQLPLALGMSHRALRSHVAHNTKSTATTTLVNLLDIVFLSLFFFLILIPLLILLSLVIFIAMSAPCGDSVLISVIYFSLIAFHGFRYSHLLAVLIPWRPFALLISSGAWWAGCYGLVINAQQVVAI